MSTGLGSSSPFGVGGYSMVNHPQYMSAISSAVDPDKMEELLEDPQYEGMMQQMLDDPDTLRQLMEENPAMKSMMNSNPMMKSMLSNPALLKMIFSNSRPTQTRKRSRRPRTTSRTAARPNSCKPTPWPHSSSSAASSALSECSNPIHSACSNQIHSACSSRACSSRSRRITPPSQCPSVRLPTRWCRPRCSGRSTRTCTVRSCESCS